MAGVFPRTLVFFGCIIVGIVIKQRLVFGIPQSRTYSDVQLNSYGNIVRDRKVSMTAAERTRSKIEREKRASARPQEHRGERNRNEMSDTTAADRLVREHNYRKIHSNTKSWKKKITKERTHKQNATTRHKIVVGELKKELEEIDENTTFQTVVKIEHEKNI